MVAIDADGGEIDDALDLGSGDALCKFRQHGIAAFLRGSGDEEIAGFFQRRADARVNGLAKGDDFAFRA